MEPYREVGERAVLAHREEYDGELTRDYKRALLCDMQSSGKGYLNGVMKFFRNQLM